MSYNSAKRTPTLHLTPPKGPDEHRRTSTTKVVTTASSSSGTAAGQNLAGRVSPSGSLYSMYSQNSRNPTATSTTVPAQQTAQHRVHIVDSPADPGDNVRVVVRVRPLNSLETARSDAKSVVCLDDQQTVQVEAADPKLSRPITFNRVFDEAHTQESLFELCGVKTSVDRAIDGYNTTVFAFGQTGSGKTFSITGPDDVSFNVSDSERWGIVPRSLRYLFESITRRNVALETRYTVKASYLEIYNEQVQDLLNPASNALPVRHHADRGFYVENLFVVECEVLDDCMAVLEEGLRNRKTASHRLNEHSSRSHGMMTLYVDGETLDPDDQRVIRKRGKIQFIDLAGSEKVKESRAQGDTLVETLNINKSLLTLGNCISALADMKKKKSAQGVHVPYRDSKLTKLLSDSLGGTGLALMIACVSPSSHNIHETLNTLRYASRAKRIENRPVVQMDAREELIMNLKQEVKVVRSENEQLRAMLSELGAGGRATAGQNSANNNSSKGPALPKLTNQPMPDNAAPAEPAVSSGPSPELQHAKQMLSKFIGENQDLKTENSNLVAGKHHLTRENRELLEENDRLVGKIEKLMQIFGSNLDQEISKFTSFTSTASQPQPTHQPQANSTAETPHAPNPNVLSNARLFLISRRSKVQAQQPTGLDMSRLKSAGDETYSAENDMPSPLGSPVLVPASAVRAATGAAAVALAVTSPTPSSSANNEKLKMELQQLDKEIDKLKPAPATRDRHSMRK